MISLSPIEVQRPSPSLFVLLSCVKPISLVGVFPLLPEANSQQLVLRVILVAMVRGFFQNVRNYKNEEARAGWP
ncbi:MAG TPA: hypothetical protein VLI68_10110 [Hanamia sp.]|nr:hypothetical protein [Hanamia sp.]